MVEYPKRIIQQGEKNARIVKALQTRLNEVGCGPLEVIGKYGPKTVAAVKLFQSTHRDQLGRPLQIDGKVGAITWAILFGAWQVPHIDDGAKALSAQALKVAISQLGVMENPEGSNSGPEVNAYLKSVGLGPGYYWCAAFIYWCFQQASAELGKKNPVFKTAGCLNHWNKTTGKKIKAAAAVENPSLLKPGHIFILNHGSGMGHTGLIEKIEGGYIHTIEGNSNPEGSSNGIGVFRLERKIATINQGYIEYK
jgi:hypothetical protein